MSRLSTIALTALAPLAWGSTYAVTTQLLPPDRPLFAGLMRALPAGLVLLAATRALPRGAWWWKSAVLGTLNIGAFFPLLFLAAYRLPGGVASVVGSVGPLFVAGLAAALLSERPSARTLTAAVVGAVGVSLVVLRAGAGFDALGLLAGVAGSASMSAGTVLTKRWGRPEGVGSLAFTGWQLTAGGLLIAPVALLVEGLPPALDARAVTGYAYLAVANTAAAYWLWFRGIGRLPATSVSLLGFLSPLSAAAIGWAVLGQALTPVQLLGMAIAFTGTLLGQLHYGRRAAQSVSVPAPVPVTAPHQLAGDPEDLLADQVVPPVLRQLPHQTHPSPSLRLGWVHRLVHGRLGRVVEHREPQRLLPPVHAQRHDSVGVLERVPDEFGRQQLRDVGELLPAMGAQYGAKRDAGDARATQVVR